jgi:hypothetical protein
MKNIYSVFHIGFAVFALPIIVGDIYRDYKQKNGSNTYFSKALQIRR